MDSYKSPKLLTHLSRADPSTRADPSSDVEQGDLPPATAGGGPPRDCGGGPRERIDGVAFTHPRGRRGEEDLVREEQELARGLSSCRRPCWHQSARLSLGRL